MEAARDVSRVSQGKDEELILSDGQYVLDDELFVVGDSQLRIIRFFADVRNIKYFSRPGAATGVQCALLLITPFLFLMNDLLGTALSRDIYLPELLVVEVEVRLGFPGGKLELF